MDFIKDLREKINQKEKELSEWSYDHLERIIIPLYSSVDLRLAEYKVAPVDTNVFPAGFNNLSERDRDNAGRLFRQALSRKYKDIEKILIVPELHTKNRFYWENINALSNILENAGYQVKVGIVSDEFKLPEADFETVSGKSIRGYKAYQEDHRVKIAGYDPDAILINNDFSEKCPKTLRDIIQPVVPPVEIGWHTRRKDIHFEFYNKLAGEVSGILGIDPWSINIDTRFVSDVDFDDYDDRSKVAEVAESLLGDMKERYSERGLDIEPFVFVKSNSGTYGMAVISASDPGKILNLNAEGRKRMRVKKGGIPVRDIVVQEAVPTSLKFGSGTIAEPVVYMVEADVAGVFYRTNTGKSEFENLNSRGMGFTSSTDQLVAPVDISPVCSLISRIASIAAGYEIGKIIREGGCKEED